jgi:GT2 family glycosyltransferase/glycosyltransferase involved in cell wall biosynthesis
MIRRLLPSRFKRYLKRLLNQWRMLRLRRLNIVATTYDVVCFPIIDWGFRWQRPQQLLSQFAKDGHRVFIVRAGAAFAMKPLRDNVWEITLVPPAPIDFYAGELEPEVAAWLPEQLDALRRALNIVCAISIVQVATWRETAIEARRRFGWKVVYDCMDEWDEFPGMNPRVLEAEKRLVAEADLVTVSAQRLLEKWPGSVLVRNGADFGHFANAAPVILSREDGEGSQNARSSHSEILRFAQDDGGAVIGYFGAIAPWFDVDLLVRVAKERPQYSFVLVGGVFDVEIPPLPNVHLLGQQPYELMPAYLREFDVCIIPFVVSNVTAATDPVKVYEYLSQGKPVVSTPMPELEPYRELLWFAGDDFAETLDRALAENNPQLRERRIAFARENTWSKRVAVMKNAIRDVHQKVSVIVISYNNEVLTRACIESVLHRSLHPNLEVIVVDNASTDGSAEMLAALDDPRVRVLLNRENAGFAAANNQALAVATGDVLVLLNNDTVVPRGWLTRMLRQLEDPAVGLVNAVTNSSGNESRISVPYTDVGDMERFAEPYMLAHEGERFDIRVAAMYCVGMRRDSYERIGPLDTRFGIGMFEDDDYSHRARLARLRVICAEDVYVHHYGQASFAKLSAATYEALWNENQAYFETKWGMPWQPHEVRR